MKRKARQPLNWRQFLSLVPVVILSVVVAMVLLAGLVFVYSHLGFIWTVLLFVFLGTSATLGVNRWLLPKVSNSQTVKNNDVDDAGDDRTFTA